MKPNLIYYPNKILRTKATNVLPNNNLIKSLAQDMFNIMYANKGIGLAANQVGSNLNMLVIDLQLNDIKNPMVIINPIIKHLSKELITYEEGCLSLPGIKAEVNRPSTIEIMYYDLNFNLQTIIATDLLAVCLQHEIDHLNGKIFLDRLSNLAKSQLLREYSTLNLANNHE